MSFLRVGVTAPEGAWGRALCERLASEHDMRVLAWPSATWDDPEAMLSLANEADVIVHLAAAEQPPAEQQWLLHHLLTVVSSVPSPPRILVGASEENSGESNLSRRGCESALKLWASEDPMRSAAVLVIPDQRIADDPAGFGFGATGEVAEQLMAVIRQPWSRFETVTLSPGGAAQRGVDSSAPTYLQAA